jgi:Zn-dependent protease/CBS domain-containing protein
MRWSLPIGRVLGFEVRLHWTLLIGALFLILASTSFTGRIGITLLLLGLAASVLCHEIGHAIMARRHGIPVGPIVLTPVGGIAPMENMCREPKIEMQVALAGPVVSLLLGGILWALAEFTGNEFPLLWLALANAAFGAFNLVPAFPLDGGRVLRASLAMRMPLVAATRWSTRIGRFLALLFVAAAWFHAMWWLALMGVFMYFAGRTEELSVQVRSFLHSRTARDVMQYTNRVLPAALRVHEGLDMAKRTSQRLFPVCFGDRPMGLISIDTLMEALASGQGDHGVSQCMHRDFLVSAPSEPLAQLLQRMVSLDTPSALVMEDGQPVGVVALDEVLQATH